LISRSSNHPQSWNLQATFAYGWKVEKIKQK